jgi:hypothetical protein
VVCRVIRQAEAAVADAEGFEAWEAQEFKFDGCKFMDCVMIGEYRRKMRHARSDPEKAVCSTLMLSSDSSVARTAREPSISVDARSRVFSCWSSCMLLGRVPVKLRSREEL